MKNSSRFDATIAANLSALEQRRRRIRRLLEHALVEGQPRQLAVDEQAASGGSASRHDGDSRAG